MQPKLGTTGLTQKEAIFQVIKDVLGSSYKEGMDVRPLVQKTNHYGRRVHDSVELRTIVERVTTGLKDGIVPSERYGSKDVTQYHLGVYARKITHYWLKHDKRLNGACSDRSVANEIQLSRYRKLKSKNQLIQVYEEAIKCDASGPTLQIIEQALIVENLKMFLKSMNIDFENLPQEIQDDFAAPAGGEKKAA